MTAEQLLKLMSRRRDVRHFVPGFPLPDEVLQQCLQAAALAPSVGLSQPTRLVVTHNPEMKRRVHAAFKEEWQESFPSSQDLGTESRRQYRQIKLQGILEAPLGMAVFCERPKEFTIGVSAMPEAQEWSVACAIENMWLLLTASGFGMGWVSIVQPDRLRQIFDVPPHWVAMGYLCLGKPATDYEGRPMLESNGWKKSKKLNYWLDSFSENNRH